MDSRRGHRLDTVGRDTQVGCAVDAKADWRTPGAFFTKEQDMTTTTKLDQIKKDYAQYKQLQGKADRLLSKVCLDSYLWFCEAGYEDVMTASKDLATSLGCSRYSTGTYIRAGKYIHDNDISPEKTSVRAIIKAYQAEGNLSKAVNLKILSEVKKGAKMLKIDQIVRQETFVEGKVAAKRKKEVTLTYLRMEMLALLTVARMKYGEHKISIAILDENAEVLQEVN